MNKTKSKWGVKYMGKDMLVCTHPTVGDWYILQCSYEDVDIPKYVKYNRLLFNHTGVKH